MFVRSFLFSALTFLANPNQLLFAQLPAARLHNVTPAGGRAGSSIEVVVAGTDLDDLKDLRFSRPGISASLKGTNRFEVTIEPDTPPGVYDVRAVGKYGASNPRTFAVGLLNEVAEDKNSSDSPQTVALESTINGRSDANTIDYFRFNAKKAQRVLARCETRALHSRLEPVLVLYDSGGREVNRARSGGFLDYSIPEDGEFTLRLYDATYRGGADFFYRLSLGTFPHVDYVMPVAGKTGEGVKFSVYGRNLPGGKFVDAQAKPALERVEVELTRNNANLSEAQTTMPAQAALGLHEYRIRSGGGASDGTLLLFPTATVVSEDEPNNTPAAARRITLPCAVTGQFFPNGDRDWFSFDANKGDVYWIEVISHRLGLPTDPFVLVQRAGTNGSTDVLELNDSEANAGGPEFNTTHRDPTGRFEAKENGTYRLQVRDLFTQPRSNPALVYHLIIRKPSPDFGLVAWPATPLPVKKDGKDIPVTTTTLRREEVMPIKVLALRRDGFDGAIDLSVPELPDILLAATARIEAGKNSTLLFVSGKSNCAPTVAALKIQGTATANGTKVMRAATPISLLWPVADPAADAVQSHSSAEYVVSTIDEMFPVRLMAAEEKTWEATAGSKLKIPLTLNVEGELSANLKLKPVGVAGLESAKEFDLDPKSTNAVYEIDLGQQKLLPGSYTFALQGLATVKPVKAGKEEKKPAGKERTVTLYSAPITLKVNPAPTNAVAK